MSVRNKLLAGLKPLGIACALTFGLAPAANATILSNHLTFDGPVDVGGFPTQGGGEDRLQDDSLSAIINRDGSVNQLGLPTFTLGDTIWGVATLSDIQASGVANATIGDDEQIAILFALDFVGTTAGGNGILGVASNAGEMLIDFCGAICAGHLDGDSVAVVLSTPDASDDPLNYTTGNFTTNFNSGLWGWEMTLGLAGDAFFEFADGGLLGSTERAAVEVTSSAFAADWAPVDVLDFAGGVHTNDVTLDDGDVQFAGDDAVSRGWAFEDQAAFFINPLSVPEPGSLALFGIALAGLAGFGRRRA
ncbi:MAG: PEP-CTERM sorting domain-containing protein [Rhodocyclaceae bacterium]|nr:PEP-CTERM sorting domain-containing protein [Rhodocyclaceae bacterium]